MQQNPQSFNIFVVSYPVAIVPWYRSTMGRFFLHENFIILKVAREIETTN